MRAGDVADIAALLGQLWPDLTLDPVRLRMLRKRCPQVSRLLASQGGRVVGFAAFVCRESLWAGGTVAYLSELVVDRDCRSRGIGRRLLAAAAARARARGCVLLELDSAHHRRRAHAFYRACGFSDRGSVFSRPLSG